MMSFLLFGTLMCVLFVAFFVIPDDWWAAAFFLVVISCPILLFTWLIILLFASFPILGAVVGGFALYMGLYFGVEAIKKLFKRLIKSEKKD